MINSKRKGKIGELEWRDFLREHGYTDAIRGRQYSGSPDSPDVRCQSLPCFHFEVKRVETLNINRAMKQAEADAGEFQIPLVCHRRNREKWLVTLSAHDFLRLVDAYVEWRAKKENEVIEPLKIIAPKDIRYQRTKLVRRKKFPASVAGKEGCESSPAVPDAASPRMEAPSVLTTKKQ